LSPQVGVEREKTVRVLVNDMDTLRLQLASVFHGYSLLRSQIATAKKGGRINLSYAFTEQGVVMLLAVLKSENFKEVC
jgi:hypothetical protein